MPYFVRVERMRRLFTSYREWRERRGRGAERPPIRMLPIARTEAEKRKLFAEMEMYKGEGVVFTHVQSLNLPGKPNAGGLRHKYKFTKELDCIVRPTESERRSFEGFVHHGGRLVSLGFIGPGVTDEIYASLVAAERRGETTVATVRYLYGTGRIEDGGKMFQATFIKFRTDKRPEECLGDQLEVTNYNVLEELFSGQAAA